MTDTDIQNLLPPFLDLADSHSMRVLVGVLKTDTDAMLRCIESMNHAFPHPAFAGITICPPKGASLTQEQIEQGLSRVLDLGVPTALYQLPQVTQNEMSPATVLRFAERYSNFFLFKDTSGNDRVALSNSDLLGVYLVRGSEQGGYAHWLRKANGPYDGFLLSTANVFAAEYDQMIRWIDSGELPRATELSEFITLIVQRAFDLVCSFRTGNAFTNANKVLDHCLAYGSNSLQVAPPMLYSGARLPKDFVSEGCRLLTEFGILPEVGYEQKTRT